MLGFRKGSKQKKTESKGKDEKLNLSLKLDNLLIHHESANSPKTPNGHSLPSPLSPVYPDTNLTESSKLRIKAEHHQSPLPENCFENRTPELARRQFKTVVYANSQQANADEWVETYGSDERFPRNRLKPTAM